MKIYEARSGARSAVKTCSKLGLLNGFNLHPYMKQKDETNTIVAADQQQKLYSEANRLIKDDTFIKPINKVFFWFII